MQKSLEGEETVNCASTLTLMANCYTKLKEFDLALDYVSRVLNKLFKIFFLISLNSNNDQNIIF